MKEYLLLRNNAESGPYSIDELKEMGLKAYDLIWIENKSFSWKYPSEINELALFAPPLPGNADEADNHKPGEENKEDWFFVQDEPVIKKEPPVKQLSHIVALRPSVENIRVKTIKPTASPNMVKVEIREQEGIPRSAATLSGYVYETRDQLPAATTVLRPVYTTGQRYRRSHLLETLFSLGDNNKMEVVVLAIGAASLLAVAYLLVTSTY
ncbi:MAG: hypothetical protein M9904_18245 [Chitinophagaceae bacterium]|nr:hypothetical protein [Chitinophagaceae bacterium]